MAEESEDQNIPVYPTLVRLTIENNALLHVLIRVVGELQAKSRDGGASDEEVNLRIKTLYSVVDEARNDIIESVIARANSK